MKPTASERRHPHPPQPIRSTPYQSFRSSLARYRHRPSADRWLAVSPDEVRLTAKQGLAISPDAVWLTAERCSAISPLAQRFLRNLAGLRPVPTRAIRLDGWLIPTNSIARGAEAVAVV